MTATISRPPAPAGPDPEPAPAPNAAVVTPPDAGLERLIPILAELALVALSVVTVLSLGRLFAEPGWKASLVIATVVAHGLAMVLRRTRLGPLAVVGIAVGSGVLVLTWLRYRDTTFLLLPTWSTLSTGRQDLIDGWHQFSEVVSPAPVFPGFLLAAALALWVAVWVSDWAAFRLGSAVEAVLPQSAIFLFVTLLGDPRDRTLSTVAFLGAALGFVLLHRVADQITSATWVGDGRRQGPPAVVGVGVAMIAVAVLAGALLGPNAPGAGSAPMIDWHGGRLGEGTRVTVSPLVDIRKRLVDQSDVEAFTVRSAVRSYWRLTALDAFDGSVWSSSGTFSEADGGLPRGVGSGEGPTATQDFSISGLDAIWLPAAFQPVDVSTDGTDVRYDDVSSTLIVDTNSDTSDGITYRVTSVLPRFTAGALDRSFGAEISPLVRARYLDLPSGFPDEVDELAHSVTASGGNPYEKARLLQNWFRNNFTYELNGTQAGHSDQAMVDFIESKRGYCEQFAGTFAAMARALDIPARVAVGFTPGDVDPESNGTPRYIVRGRNAHAWPEVYINQAWVPFEPTPGRGAPGAEAWTGVPEQQDSADSVTTTTPRSTASTASIPTTLPAGNNLPDEDVSSVGGGSTGTSGPMSPVTKGAIGVLILLLAVAAYLGLLAATRALRRSTRRRRATTDAARVRVAWLEGAEAVGRVAPPLRPAETHTEFAARVRPVIGPASRPLGRLAGLATATEWSDGPVPDDVVRDACSLSDEVDHEIRETQDLRQRVRSWFDPRQVLRRSEPATRA